MPAERPLSILNLLRARKSLTAAQLAEELGVSVRTIYRDIEDLRGSGVPIAGEAGVGYRLQSGFELPPLTFDGEELAALVTGARMVFRYADPELGAAAKRALAKIEAALPKEHRERLRSTAVYVPAIDADRVHPIAPIDSGPAHLGDLRRAVDQRHKVRLEYLTQATHYAERVVRPVGLFFWGRGWSLAAWCELRGDWRNFRLDRMRAVDVTDDTWADDGRDIEAFMVSMRERNRP